MQPVKVLAHLRPALKTPATGHAHQLHPFLHPVLLQLLQKRLDTVGTQHIVEQHAQIPHAHRLRGTNQRGLKDPLGIHRVHGSEASGEVARCTESATPRIKKKDSVCQRSARQ